MRFSLANIMSLYCGWWFLAAYGRPCQLEEPKLWCHITLYWGWFEMAGAGLGWAGHRNLDTGHNLHIYGDQGPAWTAELLVVASLASSCSHCSTHLSSLA